MSKAANRPLDKKSAITNALGKEYRSVFHSTYVVPTSKYICYYLPVYCYLKIKNIVDIDFENSSATMNCVFHIYIPISGLLDLKKEGSEFKTNADRVSSMK